MFLGKFTLHAPFFAVCSAVPEESRMDQTRFRIASHSLGFGRYNLRVIEHGTGNRNIEEEALPGNCTHRRTVLMETSRKSGKGD